MEMRQPGWSGDDIAPAPFKTLTVDRRRAGSFYCGVNIVCGGLVWRSFGARGEPHHEQTDRVHRRVAKLDLSAEPARRIRRRGIEALRRFTDREYEGRVFGRWRFFERLVSFIVFGRLEEHRFEQLHK